MSKHQSRESKAESRALLFGFFINLFMGMAGLYVFMKTDIDAIFLDGSFSLISALGCIAAILISKYSDRKTKRFPNGMYFLEPLYASFKGLLSLVLLVAVGISAVSKLYDYLFLDHGKMLEMGDILYYSLLMTFLCFLLGGVFAVYNRKINGRSTMLDVEAKASFVDAIISLGIGVAVLLITLLPKEGNTLFVYYVGDAVMALVLIIFMIKTPFDAFRESFTEVMNGVIRKGKVKASIDAIVKLENSKADAVLVKAINIHKVGKKLEVVLNVSVEDGDYKAVDLIRFREKLLHALRQKYTNVFLSLIIE